MFNDVFCHCYALYLPAVNITPLFIFIKINNINQTNGRAHFKNVNNCLNATIYSHLETSGGQSSNLYLYIVHFFNTSVN